MEALNSPGQIVEHILKPVTDTAVDLLVNSLTENKAGECVGWQTDLSFHTLTGPPSGRSSKCGSVFLCFYLTHGSRRDFCIQFWTWCRVSSIFRYQGSNGSLSPFVPFSLCSMWGWAHVYSFILLMFYNSKYLLFSAAAWQSKIISQAEWIMKYGVESYGDDTSKVSRRSTVITESALIY